MVWVYIVLFFVLFVLVKMSVEKLDRERKRDGLIRHSGYHHYDQGDCVVPVLPVQIVPFDGLKRYFARNRWSLYNGVGEMYNARKNGASIWFQSDGEFIKGDQVDIIVDAIASIDYLRHEIVFNHLQGERCTSV